MPANTTLGACLTVIFALWLDLWRGQIPNWLTVVSFLGGFIVNSIWGIGFPLALAGAAVGIGILFIPFMLGGFGGGDVKLFGALGAWLGWRGVVLTVLLTAMAGAAVALVILIHNQGKQGGFSRLIIAWRTKNIDLFRTSQRIPYTVPTAIGLVLYLILSRSV